MSEQHPYRALLRDNPPDHDVLILVVQAFENYMENDRDWKRQTTDTLAALHSKVDIQNSNTAKLTNRANEHDKWHGENDEQIAYRLATLWKEREAALIRKGVYLTWWRVVAWVIGVAASFGAGGLLIGRFA